MVAGFAHFLLVLCIFHCHAAEPPCCCFPVGSQSCVDLGSVEACAAAGGTCTAPATCCCYANENSTNCVPDVLVSSCQLDGQPSACGEPPDASPCCCLVNPTDATCIPDVPTWSCLDTAAAAVCDPQCLPTCYDYDANLVFDGRVSVEDLAALLARWGPCPSIVRTPGTLYCSLICVGDLDRDNRITIADLANLLAAWGPC